MPAMEDAGGAQSAGSTPDPGPGMLHSGEHLHTLLLESSEQASWRCQASTHSQPERACSDGEYAAGTALTEESDHQRGCISLRLQE